MDDKMENIKKQIRDTMEKAWHDSLIQNLKSTPPKYDYIIILYTEIRDKLINISFTKEKKEFLSNRLDVELFKQMITNDAFNTDDFLKLVEYIFNTCLALGAPIRDNDVKKMKEKVLSAFQTDVFEGIASFFLNVNKCIDWIYIDLENFEKIETKYK